jgi:hypothetical protein
MYTLIQRLEGDHSIRALRIRGTALARQDEEEGEEGKAETEAEAEVKVEGNEAEYVKIEVCEEVKAERRQATVDARLRLIISKLCTRCLKDLPLAAFRIAKRRRRICEACTKEFKKKDVQSRASGDRKERGRDKGKKRGREEGQLQAEGQGHVAPPAPQGFMSRRVKGAQSQVALSFESIQALAAQSSIPALAQSKHAPSIDPAPPAEPPESSTPGPAGAQHLDAAPGPADAQHLEAAPAHNPSSPSQRAAYQAALLWPPGSLAGVQGASASKKASLQVLLKALMMLLQKLL